MIELNKDYTVTINDEDFYGNGITRINNIVIFIPYSFLNEKLLIKIIKIDKRYAIGRIVEIISSSNERKDIKCNKYLECGGCSFLHTDIEYELDCKKKYISSLFNIDFNIINNIEYNYRNKATFHINNNELGYFSENSHDLVSFDNCLLLDNRINEIYNYIKLSDLSKVTSIMIRVTNKELLIKIDGEYDYNKLVEDNKIDSLYINDRCIYGKEYIIEEIDGIKYSIFPDSFFQVNTNTMIKLYDKVKEYANSGNKLLDLYCGTGTIGIYLKDNYKDITGIEINKSSIANANINKKINNLNSIKFVLGDSKIANKDDYDTIIVDPPRNGLSKEVINYLNNTKSNIIYVSCNPKTLKRDIELLDNYNLCKLTMVNMFPKTKHVECVCLLKSINQE